MTGSGSPLAGRGEPSGKRQNASRYSAAFRGCAWSMATHRSNRHSPCRLTAVKS